MNVGQIKLEPVKRTFLVEHAVQAIRERIIKGNLRPGTVLPTEREMAREMGMSKFSLREALRVLQVLGLIDISQGRRTRVAMHSVSPLISVLELTLRRSKVPDLMLIEARKSLEGHISRYAAMRADSSHIEAMRATIEEIKSNRNDLDMCVEKDLEFHAILVKASQNVAFEIMLAPLMKLLRKQRMETIKVRGVELMTVYHTMILRAIMEKDSEKAEGSMILHLAEVEEDLRKAMQFCVPPQEDCAPDPAGTDVIRASVQAVLGGTHGQHAI